MEDPHDAVRVQEREPLPILSIRENVAIARLADAQGERLRELWQSFRSRRLIPTGPPFVRYHTFGDTETDMEIGVPVGDGAAGERRIRAGELPGGPVIATWHLGCTRQPRGGVRSPRGVAEGTRPRGGRSRVGGVLVDRCEPGARPVHVARAHRVAHRTRPAARRRSLMPATSRGRQR
jgi:hypothetical protein